MLADDPLLDGKSPGCHELLRPLRRRQRRAEIGYRVGFELHHGLDDQFASCKVDSHPWRVDASKPSAPEATIELEECIPTTLGYESRPSVLDHGRGIEHHEVARPPVLRRIEMQPERVQETTGVLCPELRTGTAIQDVELVWSRRYLERKVRWRIWVVYDMPDKGTPEQARDLGVGRPYADSEVADGNRERVRPDQAVEGRPSGRRWIDEIPVPLTLRRRFRRLR